MNLNAINELYSSTFDGVESNKAEELVKKYSEKRNNIIPSPEVGDTVTFGELSFETGSLEAPSEQFDFVQLYGVKNGVVDDLVRLTATQFRRQIGGDNPLSIMESEDQAKYKEKLVWNVFKGFRNDYETCINLSGKSIKLVAKKDVEAETREGESYTTQVYSWVLVD